MTNWKGERKCQRAACKMESGEFEYASGECRVRKGKCRVQKSEWRVLTSSECSDQKGEW